MAIPLSHTDRLREFYAVHNPSKLETLSDLLAQYLPNREEELFNMLVKKFGPEPGGADAGGAPTQTQQTRLARYFAHYHVPFFQQYKVTEVDRILHEFKDREHDLFFSARAEVRAGAPAPCLDKTQTRPPHAPRCVFRKVQPYAAPGRCR